MTDVERLVWAATYGAAFNEVNRVPVGWNKGLRSGEELNSRRLEWDRAIELAWYAVEALREKIEKEPDDPNGYRLKEVLDLEEE